MGYHVKKIKKGEFGKFSKVQEEFEELLDAREQGVKVMELVELSDLYCAIQQYIRTEYNLSMDDLKNMARVTKSAFDDGTRKPDVVPLTK